MKFQDYDNKTGYNHCLKRSKYNLDDIEDKLKSQSVDYKIDDYGLFFKDEDYNKVISIIQNELTEDWFDDKSIADKQINRRRKETPIGFMNTDEIYAPELGIGYPTDNGYTVTPEEKVEIDKHNKPILDRIAEKDRELYNSMNFQDDEEDDIEPATSGKSNGRKNMLPLFVYLIIEQSSKPLLQKDIQDILSRPPYELQVERKSISRTIHSIEQEHIGIVSKKKDGRDVWYFDPDKQVQY